MRRRDFITLLGGTAAAWPIAARAQGRMRRIGVVLPTTADNSEFQARLNAFLQGLRQLGRIDDRNLQIDTRWATTNADDIRRQATELAALAPDAVAYISGLSKSLAPGVRTGFLLMPAPHQDAALEALRASTFGPPTLGAALATQWIESGIAFDIFAAVRRELARRTAVAVAALAGLAEPIRQSVTPHLWLPLGELEAERVAGHAMRSGVRVTPPSAPYAEGIPVEGLRVCLGAAPDIEALERGLSILRAALQPGHALGDHVV